MTDTELKTSQIMSILPDGFCKTEKVQRGCNKQGDFKIACWINDKVENTLYFPTKYAAEKFRKNHQIINGKIMETQK